MLLTQLLLLTAAALAVARPAEQIPGPPNVAGSYLDEKYGEHTLEIFEMDKPICMPMPLSALAAAVQDSRACHFYTAKDCAGEPFLKVDIIPTVYFGPDTNPSPWGYICYINN